MAQNHTPVSVDPESLNHSKAVWANFLTFAKILVIGNVVLLLGMAIFLT